MRGKFWYYFLETKEKFWKKVLVDGCSYFLMGSGWSGWAPVHRFWHIASLKLKKMFGTREGFEICPHQFRPHLKIFLPWYSGVSLHLRR